MGLAHLLNYSVVTSFIYLTTHILSLQEQIHKLYFIHLKCIVLEVTLRTIIHIETYQHFLFEESYTLSLCKVDSVEAVLEPFYLSMPCMYLATFQYLSCRLLLRHVPSKSSFHWT